MDTYILTYLALIPPVFLIWLIYKIDYVEKEPPGLILQIFILGALSPIIIYAVQYFLNLVFSPIDNPLIHGLIDAFIIAAFIEETAKYLIVINRTWNHKAFNYRFDAMVYTVTASLGLAAVENIAYVFSFTADYGAQFGVEVAISRMLQAIPGHAADAVFMGYYIGEAKMCQARGQHKKARKNLLLALLVPVVLHGLYDAALFIGTNITMIFFYAFIVILYIYAIIKVLRYSKHDDYFKRHEQNNKY